SVLEDIDFVGIDPKPIVDGTVAVVAHLEREITPNHALNAEIPRFRVRLFEIGLDAVDPRNISEERVLVFGVAVLISGRRKAYWRDGISQREAARGKRARRASVIRVKAKLLVIELPVISRVVPEVLVGLGITTERKTAADNCISIAENFMQHAAA